MKSFIVLFMFLFSMFYEIRSDTINQPIKTLLDTMRLDSLDSIYLRTTDFTCDTIEGVMIICTITERKADSILKYRRDILRRR